MSLERVFRHDEALFEFLWCPVCGTEAFTHIPFEGVFCTECNTSVTCRESPESRGYDDAVIITFDATTACPFVGESKMWRHYELVTRDFYVFHEIEALLP